MDQIIPAAREKFIVENDHHALSMNFTILLEMSAAPIPVSTGRDEISRWGGCNME